MARVSWGVAILVLGSMVALGDGPDEAKKDDKPVTVPGPKPEYTPEQVVKFVVEALQHNDTPRKDAGIETAFNFASPANRAATGPLDRFIRLVNSPTYKPMIDHKSSEIRKMRIVGGIATQRVQIIAIDGQAVVYEFTLTKDPVSGCWVSDGVVVIPIIDS